MKKTMLPALTAIGVLAACSGGTEAPKEDAAAQTDAPAVPAAADDDNDAAAPAPAKADDDHPHGADEGEHKH